MSKRGLTAEQLFMRRNGIGASDAAKIVGGQWHELWLDKVGQAEHEDLSWVLPVQIGIVTEELNIDFFEHATGLQVFGRGERYRHPDHDFITATLDGLALLNGKPAILECKHVNPFAKIDEVEQRYYPQCAHSMLVTGASLAYLSVFMGTQKHEIVEVRRDRDYTAHLLNLEVEFWGYVERREPPPDHAPVASPEKPAVFRTVDFAGSNEWTVSAVDWLETKAAAQKNDKAAKALRAMVEADVGHACGAGVEAVRSRDGRSLYLRASK